MTKVSRLLKIADLAYRFRQVDGSAGYDAGQCLKLGKSLDTELRALHEELGKPYTKKMDEPGRHIERFALQETKSFPEGPPQRENYDSDEACFKAEKKYETEWRAEYSCPGCVDPGCPQCGRRTR